MTLLTHTTIRTFRLMAQHEQAILEEIEAKKEEDEKSAILADQRALACRVELKKLNEKLTFN